MAAQSFPNCLSYLTFLGRLLHSIPSLCGYLIYSFGIIVSSTFPPNTYIMNWFLEGGFLEFILQVLAYPDEAVKSAVVYTLAQLSMKSPPNSLPPSLVQAVCGHVSSSLASAKSHNLTLNLLGTSCIIIVLQLLKCATPSLYYCTYSISRPAINICHVC